MPRSKVPSRILVKLYYLLEKDPFISNIELAEKLDVNVEAVQTQKNCLINWCKEVLSGYCPRCFKKAVFPDEERGERVCRNCGLVVGAVQRMSNNLPWDTTYAFTSNLAFGKSLGNTLPNSRLYRVLAKAPAGRKDLPIRSRQIAIIQNAVDPPVAHRMLNYGSRMLKDLGMNQDTENCHVLADRCGRLLRKLAAFLQISKLNVQSHLVTRAAIYYLLRELKPEKADESRRKFPFKQKYLNIVEKLDKLEKEVKT